MMYELIGIGKISHTVMRVIMKRFLSDNLDAHYYSEHFTEYITILIKWMKINYKEGMDINILLSDIKWGDIYESDIIKLYADICNGDFGDKSLLYL